jgi:hypothetical protein
MTRKWLLVGALAVALAGTVTGTSAAAQRAPTAAGGVRPAAAPACDTAWGSLPKEAGVLSTATLLSTRTGQHDCWDRLVFEFSGPVDGYRIAYGDVFTDGQGLLMNPYVAGGAVLGVSLRAPAYGDGVPTYPAVSGQHVAAVLGYRTLRDVMFGGSFEGYTTFAVGVRATLPFRVLVLPGPGSHSRIVLDVAHTW